MKVCTRCGVEKSLDSFHQRKRKSGIYGPREHCKECRKAVAKEEYLSKDKQKHLLETLRGRAKKLGVPFDLEYSDLNPPDVCPVFGVELKKIDPYSNQSKRFSTSVDRVDPGKGYTKDNIQIISQLANVMKHDASQEELVMFAKWVFKTYGDS